MKKINFTILIISILFFTGNVSSAQADLSCSIKASCDSGEVSLLEMAKATNSHAGVVGTGYDYSICCAGVDGLSNSCSGNGEAFLKLYNENNSHVYAATEDNYSDDTELACVGSTDGSFTIKYKTDCEDYGVAVASMAAYPYNSHIGGPDDYSTKVCVKYKAPSSGGGYLPSVSAFLGNVVSTASSVFVSDNPEPVQVITQNTNYTETRDEEVVSSVPTSTVAMESDNTPEDLRVDIVGMNNDIVVDNQNGSIPTNSEIKISNNALTASVNNSKRNLPITPVALMSVGILGLVFTIRKLVLVYFV